MPRVKAPINSYRAASSEVVTQKTVSKPVTLQLPPAHPLQFQLINAFEVYPDLRFVVGACGTKFGKAISVNEDIPTPSGWRKFGDIREGDYVFDENGKPTLVEYATDEMHGHTLYE